MAKANRRKAAAAAGSSVAEQLRTIIAARGLTPYKVAREAGLDPSTVTRFCNRERLGSVEAFDAVCQVLGLKLTEGRGGLRSTHVGRRPNDSTSARVITAE